MFLYFLFSPKIAELILEFAKNNDTKFPCCIYVLSLTCKKLNKQFHKTIKGAHFDVIKELIKTGGNKPMELQKFQSVYLKQWCPIWKKFKRAFETF
jgi:hypothetical protein